MKDTVTTNELTTILTFLEGKVLKHAYVLSMLKKVNGATMTSRKYWIASKENAWNFLSEKYGKILEQRNITDIGDLMLQADAYWETNKEALEWDGTIR